MKELSAPESTNKGTGSKESSQSNVPHRIRRTDGDHAEETLASMATFADELVLFGHDRQEVTKWQHGHSRTRAQENKAQTPTKVTVERFWITCIGVQGGGLIPTTCSPRVGDVAQELHQDFGGQSGWIARI